MVTLLFVLLLLQVVVANSFEHIVLENLMDGNILVKFKFQFESWSTKSCSGSVCIHDTSNSATSKLSEQVYFVLCMLLCCMDYSCVLLGSGVRFFEY